MIKTIAFHILKGGVGKTTLSGNIAYKISETKKTILIDCDIQANSSNWFLNEKPEYELADCLQGELLSNAIKQIKPNFYILPTKTKDSNLKNYAETKLFQEPFIFEDLNTELQKLGFEYAIYDLSPSISQLERCILLAINEVITPITPEYFSFDGIELFYNELQKI
ncbi:plasmid partition protein, partial [Brachyspira hyodysenteriae]